MYLKNYRNVRSQALLAIKITLLVSIPLAALYIGCPYEFASFLYKDPKAAASIAMMGLSTIFLSMQHILSGVMNGLGQQKRSALHRMFGILIQLLCVFYLSPLPQFGIKSYFLGFFLCTLIICLMDFFVFKNHLRLAVPWGNMAVKPLFASLFMIISLRVLYPWMGAIIASSPLAFLFSLIAGFIFYFSILFITKALPSNLISRLLDFHKGT